MDSPGLRRIKNLSHGTIIVLICVCEWSVTGLEAGAENSLGWSYNSGQDAKILSRVVGDDDNQMENELVKFLPAEGSSAKNRYFQELSQDEKECPEGYWWHLRGARCVPTTCLGGNRQRDPGTGECIRKSGRKFNKGLLNYFSRMSSYRRFMPSLKHYRGRRIMG